MNRWAVRKRNGKWRVTNNGAWHETHNTLTEAHTAATQYAIIDQLCTPGGLTKLTHMQLLWRAMSNH